MSMLLFIETTSEVCSVALTDNSNLLSEQNSIESNSHSSVLHDLIRSLFLQTNTSISNLSAVVVSEGPGSYTGLRVGTSAAKGICMALNIPLIAVNTLKAMSLQFVKNNLVNTNVLLCPMIDARRKEVFAGVFDLAGNEIISSSNFIIDEFFLESLLSREILFLGNGAFKMQPFIKPNQTIFNESIIPLAQNLIETGFQKYNRKQFENLANFEPAYLKPVFITERKK